MIITKEIVQQFTQTTKAPRRSWLGCVPLVPLDAFLFVEDFRINDLRFACPKTLTSSMSKWAFRRQCSLIISYGMRDYINNGNITDCPGR
jgi:hypothetical protein